MSVENHWGETVAVLVASVGCVMRRPFGCFTFREVLCWGCRGVWVLRGWAQAGGNGKIPGLRDHVLPLAHSDVGKSVVAGPLRESVSVRAGLEQAGFLYLGAKACFVGGFVEHMCPSRDMECGGGVAVRVRSASQSKRGELAPPTSQATSPGRWCNSREIRSPPMALSIRESKVCASHRKDKSL